MLHRLRVQVTSMPVHQFGPWVLRAMSELQSCSRSLRDYLWQPYSALAFCYFRFIRTSWNKQSKFTQVLALSTETRNADNFCNIWSDNNVLTVLALKCLRRRTHWARRPFALNRNCRVFEAITRDGNVPANRKFQQLRESIWLPRLETAPLKDARMCANQHSGTATTSHGWIKNIRFAFKHAG